MAAKSAWLPHVNFALEVPKEIVYFFFPPLWHLPQRPPTILGVMTVPAAAPVGAFHFSAEQSPLTPLMV